jgi:hypothetical protein
MNGNCLDIGTIQAFLDGELTPELSMSVSGHVATCNACSLALGEAEEESAFVFPVLEREINTLVPTQRLWSKINESITVEKENTPFWKKVLSGIAVSLRNPSIAVAASVVIVFGVFAVVYNIRSDRVDVAPNQPITRIDSPQAGPGVVPVNTGSNIDVNNPAPVAKVHYSSSDQKVVTTKAIYSKPSNIKGSTKPEVVNAGYLPGEESYVKTINNLSQTVSGQKDSVMRPSQQVAYERDLAVVNDSIKRMRTEVRKNPKNESAKQVLYTSYQNKIDLLNSVAQKEELVASLNLK